MAHMRQLITSILICMLLPQILFVGCSVIGALVGASQTYDDRIPVSHLISGEIKQGDYLVVTRKDFATIKGKFLGVTTLDEATYREEYIADAGNLEDIGILPLPGDSLAFTHAVAGGKMMRRGRFLGLDPDALLVRGMRSRPDGEGRFEFDAIDSLHVEGKGNVNLTWLRGLISQKYLPTVTTQIALRSDADSTLLVPMADISYVEVDRAHYGWLIGLGIGCAVDLVVLSAIASSTESSCSKSLETSHSSGCTKSTGK